MVPKQAITDLSQAARMSAEDLSLLASLLTLSRNKAKASRYFAVPSLVEAAAVASPPNPSWSGAAVEMPKTDRMRVTYAAALRTRNGWAGGPACTADSHTVTSV